MCLKQDIPIEQLEVFVKNLMQTTNIPDKFKLTEEQLVRIAIDENISIAQANSIETPENNFELNESQLHCLFAQTNMFSCASLASNISSDEQQLPLFLQLDQLIELCDQQKIDLDMFLGHNSSKCKFNLIPAQIQYLIHQNRFHIEKLIDIEQSPKASGLQAQQFRLNSSQLAYLFANHRIEQNHELIGLSAGQLIGLYLLQQQTKHDEQTSLFSITYPQIKQLALFQNMSLKHLQSLSNSDKPLQLTRNQLAYITMENKTPIKQIVSIPNNQQTKVLDQEQLCNLIHQNSSTSTIQKSTDNTFHTQQRICLNIQQIFALAKYSDLSLHELSTCVTDCTDKVEFCFKPEQLASLWTTSIVSADEDHITALPESLPEFILSDEQFRCLLRSVSNPITLTSSTKSITSIKSNVESKLSSSSGQSIKSNEPRDNISVSTDIQDQSSSSPSDQLMNTYEGLKSNVQAHAERVNVIINSLLKRNRVENTINLIRQLSLYSIDDISNKQLETIPSFALDLLKMNLMPENLYKSIIQGEITSDLLDKRHDSTGQSQQIIDLVENNHLTKTIIEGIQNHQLSLSQIHKIQTQLLTPNLMNEFKSGHLSPHILDAYKSLSPLQIINKVRSSITQLNNLLRQQSSADIKKATSSTERVDTLSQTLPEDPAIIFPESTVLRQQILQELRDCLNTQLVELKNLYGIEPIKGKPSIQQITNKLRTMEITKDLELLLGRQIDEIDILNILEGHINYFLVQNQIDSTQINDLINLNSQDRTDRTDRINEKIHLFKNLQKHIENQRLKRRMNLEEFRALVLEDIPTFEQLTQLHLTEDDLRALSMYRFTTLEQLINRSLTKSEYRYLLQTNSPLNYIEQELLKRPLTNEERAEYEELFHGKIPENLKPTRKQLEQILEKRTELVDQYDILHSIVPSIKLVEQELHRSLTLDEKKRLTHDDYSILELHQPSKPLDIKEKSQKLLPITASVVQLVEDTQDKKVLENMEQLETDLRRSLTKQEIIMAAKGDLINLEKQIDKSLSSETIKSMYNDRFNNLNDELNRNLSEKEIRDVLSGKSSGIEKALSRQLTSTERLTLKSVNTIDLTASQLTNTSSIDRTVQELEDVLERRLTSDEIQNFTDQQTNLIEKDSEKKSSIEKLHVDEQQQIQLSDSKVIKDNFEDQWFAFDRMLKQPIQFSLTEIEKAIGKSLNSDELERFADRRFDQIERDLGKSLNDLQRSNLLKGDKLTIESLINRKLSPEETGPHLIDLTNIERILNRSLTLDELTDLAGDRFDEVCHILQRPLTQDELIDLLNGNYENIKKIIEEELNRQKEEELKALPIKRIRQFENILDRELSSDELLRFDEDRFQALTSLSAEQILDLSSGHYDKIENSLGRPLTPKEKYQLKRNLLESHLKYSNVLEEVESLIQRKLTEEELKTLIGNQYDEIEMRLGKSLTEEQLRNIFNGQYDPSLNEVKDLVNHFRKKYEDGYNRTHTIANRLIEQLDQDYHEYERESTVKKSPTSSIHGKGPDSDVEKHEIDKYLSDILANASVLGQDELKKQEEEVITPVSVSSSIVPKTESSKAFDNILRIVEEITDKEYIEEMTTLTDAIDKFQENLPKTEVEKRASNQSVSTWLSNFNTDTTPVQSQSIHHESSPKEIHKNDDIRLGWTLFKSIDRPELGLRTEQPVPINVKHQAKTYVVGIPEEYADEKSKNIAHKLYQGKKILYRSSKSRIMKEMGEFVSQLFQLPLINDATHFIVPSRAYIDIFQPMNTYESKLIDIENDQSEVCDAPETLEWYEECIQQNNQVQARIPAGYQSSVVYCHTGRQMIITPTKRAEQRKISMANSIEKPRTLYDQPHLQTLVDTSILNTDSVEHPDQPILESQSIETKATAQTVNDLIMHTVTTCQKSDLLEVLDELFSQENLNKYQMTETHWQDIFLILLNSYLHSHAKNRKEIFKRLTDKLQELRLKEQQPAPEVSPAITIVSPNSLSEMNMKHTEQKQYYFGLLSPSTSMKSDQTRNDSEYSITPVTTTEQNSAVLPSNNDRSPGLISQNYSALPTSQLINLDLTSTRSITNVNQNPYDAKLPVLVKSNTIAEQLNSSKPMKDHRYKITIVYSDELSDRPSDKSTKETESIKLPSIVSKTQSSPTKQSTRIFSLTNKHIKTKLLSNFQNK